MAYSITPFSLLEIVAPMGYLAFSLWAAYTSGYNMALMAKHKPKGAGKYGPYLTIAASFAGTAAMIFLGLDALAYESGFLHTDLPAALSNLDFFTFLLKQFSSIKIFDTRYFDFIVLSLVLAVVLSLSLTLLIFKYGKSKIEK